MTKILFILLFLCFTWAPRIAIAETSPYLSIGPVGTFQVHGNNRDLQPGPGVQFQGGKDWDRLGIRGKMIISSHDDDAPFGGRDQGVEFVAATFDVKLVLLGFFEMTDSPFQPYIYGGGGPYFMTEGSVPDNDDATGVGGNLGFGFEYLLFEHFGIGMDNAMHFVAFVEDSPIQNSFINEHNDFEMYLYTLSASAIFHF